MSATLDVKTHCERLGISLLELADKSGLDLPKLRAIFQNRWSGRAYSGPDALGSGALVLSTALCALLSISSRDSTTRKEMQLCDSNSPSAPPFSCCFSCSAARAFSAAREAVMLARTAGESVWFSR